MTNACSADPAIDLKEVRSIAVLRALQLGDVLCAIPALRALRRSAPQARIELIGLPWAKFFAHRFSQLLDGWIEFPGFRGLPERPFDVQRFQSFERDMRDRRFDLIVQMHGSGGIVNELCAGLGARQVAGFCPSSELCPDPHWFLPYPDRGLDVDRHLALARFLGAATDDNHLEFPLLPEDEAALETALAGREIVPRRYVCLHPGARYLSRRWPAERFAQLGDRLAAAGYDIVLTGSEEERRLADAVECGMVQPPINLAGRTTLGAVALLVSRAAVVVTNDTGMSHIADAVSAPSVVLILGSDASRWAPRNRDLHAIVTHRVPCQPCDHRSCPIDFPCASGLTVERIAEACFQMLSLHRVSPRVPRSVVLYDDSPSLRVS
jgi:ADP-heptose:LPS heptosyltransferase